MRNIILKYNLILFFILPLIIPTIAMSKTSVSEYSMLIDEDWSSVMLIYRNMDNDETYCPYSNPLIEMNTLWVEYGGKLCHRKKAPSSNG